MTPYERDLLVRTVLGEAGSESDEGQQAVASVVLNRLKSGGYGKSLTDVILQPNAFEAWSKPNQSMSLPADSPAYQKASAAVDAAMSGGDPTSGAVNYVNPELQSSEGRAQPDWATGDGQRIGRHVFYGGKPETTGDAFDSAFGGDTASAPTQSATTAAQDNNDAFSAAFGGAAKPDAAATQPPPAAAAPAPDAPAVGAGGSWVDTTKLGQFGSGLLRGVMDVGDTVTEHAVGGAAGLANLGQGLGIVPADVAGNLNQFSSDYTANDRRIRDAWVAAHPASPPILGVIPSDPASIGRLGGQIAATAPALAATGPVAATGNALADAALTGSALGAEGSALTTSSNDAPAAEQILGGAALGGLVGGGAPALAQGARALAGRVVNGVGGLSDSVVSHVAGLLDKAGLTAQDATQAVHDLGPGATLADVDPSLQTEAGALAARGGETTSLIKSRLAARAANGGTRTTQAIDQALGPVPDKTLVEDKIVTDAQQAAAPSYAKAYASGQSLDVAPVVQQIDGMLTSAVGKRAQALNEFKSYLLDANGQPKTSLQDLHTVRQEMDDYIDKASGRDSTSAGRNAVAALSQVRSGLDKIMKTNPDMAAGDQAFAQGMKVKDYFELGQSIFDNGTRLPDLQRMVQSATPEQLQALQQGARIAIGDKVGASTRGELQDAQSLFGKKTQNRDKLRLVYPSDADQVLDTVAANQSMRTTENKALSPSATAEYTAAQQRYKPAPPGGENLKDFGVGLLSGVLSGQPLIGVGAGVGSKVLSGAAGALRKRFFDNLAQGTAHALTTTGPELDQILTRVGQWVKQSGARNATNKLVKVGAGAAPLFVHRDIPNIVISARPGSEESAVQAAADAQAAQAGAQ